MCRFKERVTVVTGAARGIGKGVALRFAEESAKVVVVDILEKELDRTAQSIVEQGGSCLAFRADVSDWTQVDRLVAFTLETFGKIDILVNNAGIGGSKPCIETSEKDWERMLAVNLTSVFLMCKRVLPEMIWAGRGKIINIASMYGMLGSPGTAAYSASKAGVINLTRQLAAEYANHNIHVNAISPGLIETEMTRHKLEDPQRRGHFVAAVPLGRNGTPRDIAGAALFLASEDADFITGHNLVVDGGQSCRIT